MSDNGNLSKLKEHFSAILSLLTVVASRPTNAPEIHKDNSLTGLLSNLNGENKSDHCDVSAFYAFLESNFLEGRQLSHINHLDALLRCQRIRSFFHEELGLHEAWILFVDNMGDVEQLWLKDRGNSVVFPEKAPEINKTRIKALTKKNNGQTDKELLNEAKPQGIVNNGADTLLNYHLYRVWLAEFLVKKNIQKNPRASDSAISSIRTIPAFVLLGDLGMLLKRTKIENQNLILLSKPEDYWQAIEKERTTAAKGESTANDYPFDAFVLDAFFAHVQKLPNDPDKKLLFFSFPLDPIDLTKDGENREHGAMWSGFLSVPKGEADLLANNGKGASNGDYARLLWRIQTLRSSLNILGQPCVRKQLENQIAASVSRKHAQMVDLTRLWVGNIVGDLQRIERETQHLHSIYFAPHTAIFAAAPRLRPLFEKDVQTKIGSMKIKGLHNPTTTENANRFKEVISAALMHILGGDTQSVAIKDLTSLCNTVDKLLTDSEDPVVPICKAIIGLSTINNQYHTIDTLRRAFMCIKQIGHTPFKPEALKWPLLPLALTFISASGGRLKSLEFTYGKRAKIEGIKIDEYWNKDELFCFGAPHLLMGFHYGLHYFPIIQYSHFLDFVEGVLSYAVGASNNTDIVGKVNMCQKNSCCVKITFGNGNSLIDPSDFGSVLSCMCLIVKRGVRYPGGYGDFKKPFMSLAERCDLKTQPEITENPKSINLRLNNYSVAIVIEKNSLVIKFNKGHKP